MRPWYFLLVFLSLASGTVVATELRLKEASALKLHGLNNHQLKLVGLSCGLKVRIRVA